LFERSRLASLSLALARSAPKVAAAAVTATSLSARDLLRNSLALARTAPKVAAAAATVRERARVRDVWRSNKVRSTAIGTDDVRRRSERRSCFP